MEVKIKVKNTNQDLEINCGSVTFREVANQCGLGDSVYIAYMGNRIYELNKYIKKAGEIEFLVWKTNMALRYIEEVLYS